MDATSKVRVPSSDGTFFRDISLAILSIAFGILLTYFTGNAPIPLQLFSFLSVWATWKDFQGFVIRDNLFFAIFIALAFWCSAGQPTEFVFSFVLVYGIVMLVESYPMVGDWENMSELPANPLYLGERGIVFFWIVSLFALMSLYMFLPVESMGAFQMGRETWTQVSSSAVYFISLLWLVGTLMYMIHVLRKYYRNRNDVSMMFLALRPQTKWILCSFSALLGFPVLFLASIFSVGFIFLRRRYRGEQSFVPATAVRFPFLFHLKKGP